MSKLIKSFEIGNGREGKSLRHYSYKLYKRPFYSLKDKYYLEVNTHEDGESKQMLSDISARSCSMDDLFGRICFKPYLVILKEQHAQRIEELASDEQLANYFSWDTHVFMEESYFHPESKEFRFMVSGWHLNHVASCRRFLTHVCGADIDSYWPTAQNQSLVWVVTPESATLHQYDTLTKKQGRVIYSHPQPLDLLLLMASCNVFRHFFDWYAILTQLEGKHVAR